MNRCLRYVSFLTLSCFALISAADELTICVPKKAGSIRVAPACSKNETRQVIQAGPASGSSTSSGYNVVDSKGKVLGDWLGGLFTVVVRAGHFLTFADLTSDGLSFPPGQTTYFVSKDCSGAVFYGVYGEPERLANFTQMNSVKGPDGNLYIWDRNGSQSLYSQSHQTWNSSCITEEKTVLAAPAENFKLAVDMRQYTPPWSLAPK